MRLSVSLQVHAAQRNFQSALWLRISSEKACPVTAQGIWAFRPEKSVFPGFLRTGAHPAPGRGAQSGREGEVDSGPESDSVRPYHPRLAALCPRLAQQGRPSVALNPSTPGRSFSALGAPSAGELALSSSWKRSIPYAHTKSDPLDGCPSTPHGLPRGTRGRDVREAQGDWLPLGRQAARPGPDVSRSSFWSAWHLACPPEARRGFTRCP